MAMKVSAPDGVKVYNVTSNKSLPQWLSEKKKRALRKDAEFTRRLELLQDFGFPAACQRIKVSPDQQYIFATGYHPPMLKVYDLANLSLKFDRHLDAEVVDFQILSEDYSKAAFLCCDRTVSFHARFGSYFKVRTPRQGRDLAYAPFSAELLVVGSAPEVYRVSLEEGRFMQPLPATSPGINACGISPLHGLFAGAGEDGTLQCWDLRQRDSLGALDAAAAAGGAGQQLTALRFDDSGLHMAVGTSGGLVALFDLRSQRPLLVKDHMYGAAIRDIKFHTQAGDAGAGLAQRHVISTDKHIVKIWDMATGKGYTSIEPGEGDINDVAVWPGSGLLMLASDAQRVGAYFVPSLGPAPRWCSFLEGLTEELEEAAPTIYDDYRFVTRAELERVGLDHLMGTALLRAYMHGFFIDNRLYGKALAMAAPLGYEQYRQQRVAAKLEEERKSRISLVRKLPKVNKQLAARLLAQQEEDAAAAAAAADGSAAPGPPAKRRKGDLGVNPMADDRFKAMFEDEEFAIDELSAEYRLLHPNAAKEKSEQDRLLSEHFEELDEEDSSSAGEDSEEEGPSTSGAEADQGHDSDSSQEQQQQKQRPSYKQQKALPQQQQQQQQARGRNEQQQGPPRVKHRAGPTMYAARDAAAAQAFRRGELLSSTLQQPLVERVAAAAAAQQRLPNQGKRLGGSKEITFVPSGSRGRGGGGGGGRRGGRGRGRGRGR